MRCSILSHQNIFSGSAHSSTAEVEVSSMDEIDRRNVPRTANGFGAEAIMIPAHRGGQTSRTPLFFEQSDADMRQGAAAGGARR